MFLRSKARQWSFPINHICTHWDCSTLYLRRQTSRKLFNLAATATKSILCKSEAWSSLREIVVIIWWKIQLDEGPCVWNFRHAEEETLGEGKKMLYKMSLAILLNACVLWAKKEMLVLSFALLSDVIASYSGQKIMLWISPILWPAIYSICYGRKGHGEASDKVWPSCLPSSRDLYWKISVTATLWSLPVVLNETYCFLTPLSHQLFPVYVVMSSFQSKVPQTKPLKKPIIREKSESDMCDAHFRFLGTGRRGRFLPHGLHSALCPNLWALTGPALHHTGREREEPDPDGEYTRRLPLPPEKGQI